MWKLINLTKTKTEEKKKKHPKKVMHTKAAKDDDVELYHTSCQINLKVIHQTQNQPASMPISELTSIPNLWIFLKPF